MAEQAPRSPEDEVAERKRELEEWKKSVDWDNKDPFEKAGLIMLHAGARIFSRGTPAEAGVELTEDMTEEQRDPVMRFLYSLRDKDKGESIKVKKERNEKTGGSLWGSSLAAVGAGGLGAGVLLGEALKMAMKVDFDAHGINAANDDATKMFTKGYDWAYGGKKAA